MRDYASGIIYLTKQVTFIAKVKTATQLFTILFILLLWRFGNLLIVITDIFLIITSNNLYTGYEYAHNVFINVGIVGGDLVNSLWTISYLKSASEISDYLIVALNSDECLINKKKKVFMSFEERKNILLNIECVNEVIGFNDDEKGSCIDALEQIKAMFPNDIIIFCNGGDRTKENIPEKKVKNIRFEYGIGGNKKKNSSSWLLKNWKYESENRVWGSFYNLFDSQDVKVKELIVEP